MYHDKNKLKSLILTDLIPYLNNRLSYYIEAVGLDTKLEFNQYLQCKSDKWDYVWFSGGEKKRIDVALMFALYDLHSAIYGKQCNILVLDEIDGRLDKSGIQSFVEIIWKDFVNNDQMTDRPDSILVISHKSEMFDAFPTKIIVEKRPPGVNGKSTVRIEGL
jgi:DNA repair exonuclease SbcCD ATPase subunit